MNHLLEGMYSQHELEREPEVTSSDLNVCAIRLGKKNPIPLTLFLLGARWGNLTGS